MQGSGNYGGRTKEGSREGQRGPDQRHVVSASEKRIKSPLERNPPDAGQGSDWGKQLVTPDLNPDLNYRPGTAPWNHGAYPNKLKRVGELETIEPLLKDQRESSV